MNNSKASTPKSKKQIVQKKVVKQTVQKKKQHGFFETILSQFGIHILSPHTLALAKQNSESADLKLELWRTLHDIILVYEAQFPRGFSVIQLDLLWEQTLQEKSHEIIELVHELLLYWEYPRKEFFEKNKDIENCSSRELLLALGWLIYHSKIFNVHRERFVLQRKENAPIVSLPPFPNNLSKLPLIQKKVKDVLENCINQHQLLRNSIHQSQSSFKTEEEKIYLRIEQIKQLYGRMKSLTKAIFQNQENIAILLHSFLSSLYSLIGNNNNIPSYSLYEISLLHNPMLLKQHEESMNYFLETLQYLQSFDNDVSNFWKWMQEVVLDLDLPPEMESSSSFNSTEIQKDNNNNNNNNNIEEEEDAVGLFKDCVTTFPLNFAKRQFNSQNNPSKSVEILKEELEINLRNISNNINNLRMESEKLLEKANEEISKCYRIFGVKNLSK